MSERTPTTVARRSRRRLAIWLGFAALGVSMGAVWATGFASITGSGTPGTSPPITASNPAAHVSDLAGLVNNDNNLAITWAGRWGTVAATNFFTVDLHGKPAGNNYDIAMLLTNNISTAGWSTLQLNVEEVAIDSPATCDSSAFDGTQHNRVIDFDTNDAGAYWNALPGGKIYCIGIAASNGEQVNGTFIRRATDGVDPNPYPAFTATVTRGT